MSKSCCEIQDLLPQYIDDVLCEAERDAVRDHLSHCEVCRQDFEVLSCVIKTAHTLPSITASDKFHNELHGKLVAEAENKQKTYKPKFHFYSTASGFVAVAAVIVLSVVTFGNLPKLDSLPGQEMITPEPTASVTRVQPASEQKEPTISEGVPSEVISRMHADEDMPSGSHANEGDGQTNNEFAQTEAENGIATASENWDANPAYIPSESSDSDVTENPDVQVASYTLQKNVVHYTMTPEGFALAYEMLQPYVTEQGICVPNDSVDFLNELTKLTGYISHKEDIEMVEDITYADMTEYDNFIWIEIHIES